MTNLERIRQMSAEEFAKNLLRLIPLDDVCLYCTKSNEECEYYCDTYKRKAVLVEWLNKEVTH